MHRIVKGLRGASELLTRPSVIPIGRPRGKKAAGLRYESCVAAAAEAKFTSARRGVWFEYYDRAGRGYCQTDVLILLLDRAVVLECKYTWVKEGQRQLDELYVPVVSSALRRPVQGIVVCRVLTAEVPVPVVSSLEEALSASGPVVWHHLASMVKGSKTRGLGLAKLAG